MRIKKKKILKVVSIALFESIILCSSLDVYARDNWAYAAGLQEKTNDLVPWVNDFETYDDCYNALVAYNKAGYSAGGDINPDRATIWKNLYASVQFFAGHASTQHIRLSLGSGIATGDTRTETTTEGRSLELIGTNAVAWGADTILVTYSGCNTAGTNGNFDDTSITYKTAVKGADIVVGFTDEINVFYMDDWTDRYNAKLGEGYGVWDAVAYANSFSYLLGNETSNAVVHHGDGNMKIGIYGNSSKDSFSSEKISQKMNLSANVSAYYNNSKGIGNKSIEERTIYKNQDKKEIKASEENMITLLKTINSSFNKDNYIVQKNTSKAINVENNEITNEIDYYNFQLKIGDYITDAAYTIVVENNNIKEVYDNNIDIEKQEQLLKSGKLLNTDIEKIDIENLKIEAQQNIQNKYNGVIEQIDQDYIYYYSIKDDKKYIVINSTTQTNTEEKAKAIDSSFYEI